MKIVKIGIIPQNEICARLLAIAFGEYRPKPDEPKIWFTSMRSLAEVLSDDNRALLSVIRNTHPASLTDLAHSTGCKVSNLSRTLKTLARYGIVELIREHSHLRPIVKVDAFRIMAA